MTRNISVIGLVSGLKQRQLPWRRVSLLAVKGVSDLVGEESGRVFSYTVEDQSERLSPRKVIVLTSLPVLPELPVFVRCLLHFVCVCVWCV